MPVIATGALVAVAESVCAQALQPCLAPGDTVVGTKVEIEHASPAPAGTELRLPSWGRGHVRSAPLASYRGVRVARRRSRLKEKEAMRTIFLRAPRALAAAVATAWLVACGGGEEALETSRQIAAAMPLVDDEGLPMPPAPAAWPEDPSVRTGNGLYATEGQADVLVANGAGVEVRLEGSDAGAIDEAVRAAIGAPEGVPVLVRGGDLRAAVAVVERLTAQGRAAVWLVTP
jgi:hypothetical protein